MLLMSNQRNHEGRVELKRARVFLHMISATALYAQQFPFPLSSAPGFRLRTPSLLSSSSSFSVTFYLVFGLATIHLVGPEHSYRHSFFSHLCNDLSLVILISFNIPGFSQGCCCCHHTILHYFSLYVPQDCLLPSLHYVFFSCQDRLRIHVKTKLKQPLLTLFYKLLFWKLWVNSLRMKYIRSSKQAQFPDATLSSI